MSLIQCPECKNMVSSHAAMCIHCGFPIQQERNNQEAKDNRMLLTTKQIESVINGNSSGLYCLSNDDEILIWSPTDDATKTFTCGRNRPTALVWLGKLPEETFAVLYDDGCSSVFAVGADIENRDINCINCWSDLRKLTVSSCARENSYLTYTIVAGLHNDGTVISTVISAHDANKFPKISKPDVYPSFQWTNIIDIAVTRDAIIGLCKDGTVVATTAELQERLDSWNNISRIIVSEKTDHEPAIFGITKEGTVRSAGPFSTDSWQDIIDISSGAGFVLGLQADGQVVGIGDYPLEVLSWSDIIALSVGKHRVAGLKANGTVLSTIEEIKFFWGYSGTDYCSNYTYEDKVSGWNNISDIVCTPRDIILGITTDGRVLSTKVQRRTEAVVPRLGSWNVDSWRYYNFFKQQCKYDGITTKIYVEINTSGNQDVFSVCISGYRNDTRFKYTNINLRNTVERIEASFDGFLDEVCFSFEEHHTDYEVSISIPSRLFGKNFGIRFWEKRRLDDIPSYAGGYTFSHPVFDYEFCEYDFMDRNTNERT